MEILIFDLVGKMAHFRKYYTNSSSLTYYFPPRTAIIGIIAGIIGIKRDKYYELFSQEKAKISLSIKTPVRKLQQTVNYIWAESIKELNLSKGQHTQIPLEIVLPEKDNLLRYRIFFHHNDKEIFNKVINAIKNKKIHYPVYLGISEFIGDVEFVDLVEAVEYKGTEDPIEIDSVINMDFLKKGEVIFDNSQYIKEKMPFEFDKDRRLKIGPKDFLIEIRRGRIKLKKFSHVFFKVNVGDEINNVVFMEK